jgi:hypothetical protein
VSDFSRETYSHSVKTTHLLDVVYHRRKTIASELAQIFTILNLLAISTQLQSAPRQRSYRSNNRTAIIQFLLKEYILSKTAVKEEKKTLGGSCH